MSRLSSGHRHVEDEGAREEAAGDASESGRVPLEGHQEHARQEGGTNQVAQSVPVGQRLLRVTCPTRDLTLECRLLFHVRSACSFKCVLAASKLELLFSHLELS